MDREAVVIRSEMTHTRQDLERKIVALQGRARELSPRRLSERYLPTYPLDRAIGGVLTLVGLRMAWGQFRQRRRRREQVRAALESYGGW